MQLGAEAGVAVAVRTIDAQTGEPVAGATVRFLPPDFDAAELEAAREVHGTDSDALFAEHAHSITTDRESSGCHRSAAILPAASPAAAAAHPNVEFPARAVVSTAGP